MASLTEVYEGHLRTVTTPRRFYAGATLFAVGAATVVSAIAVATTDVGATLGHIGARRLAGVLAGLGLPASVLGVFAVLPAGRATRAAAVIGASVAVLGVALFSAAYPEQWFGAGDPLAYATAVVYFLGVITTLSCLFAALTTFKTRNDPGGTARMEITESGSVRLVEAAEPSGLGSVGMFGTDPEGEVPTQTNRESPAETGTESTPDAEILDDRPDPLTGDRPGADGHPTADGGSAAVDGGPAASGGAPAGGGSAPADRTDAEFPDAAAERGRPDAYCGNCEHFEYVKAEETITPHCGLHDELMEDMDACEEWSDAG